MSGKYALIIGNTEYIDPGLAQLTAPGKDAEDFARILKDPEICAFDHVTILLNQLSSTVIEAIDEFFDQKKPDDLLVLYFSGHGVRDELGSLYLAVRNTIRSRLRSTAIRSDFIREAMDQSRSKRQVLILDCCNSGAFSQGTKAATGVSIGTASAFEVGYGRIILTASDSTQFAWEGDRVIGETDNSLFTHFLVQGLEGNADLDSDGSITVDELYDYAYEKVKLATPKQTPSKFSSKQQGEIVLRQSMRIEDVKPVTLPDDLISEIDDLRPYVREGAVQQLEKLLKGKNLGLARSAREALERIEKEDDSRRVSQTATQALQSIRQSEQQKAEEEQKAREEAERLAALNVEELRLVAEKAENERLLVEQEAEKERKARREVKRLAALRAEEERLAREKAELEVGQQAERKAKEVEHLIEQEDEGEERTAKAELVRPQLVPQRLSISKWTMIGTMALAILATGIWGIPYFNSSMTTNPTETPAILAAIVKASTIPSTQTPTETPTLVPTPFGGGSGRIIFASNRDEPNPDTCGDNCNDEIYVMNVDGSGQTRLTNNSAIDARPAWSPDGKRISFQSTRDGNVEIYVMNADRSGQTRLTNNSAIDARPAWSPDGKHIAFQSLRDGDLEIYVMNADGSGQTRLTNNGAFDYRPAWSPDGKHIAFASNRDEPNPTNCTNCNLEIYVMNADGSGQTRLTNNPASDYEPAWSFDGKYIAFVSTRNEANPTTCKNCNSEIYVMNDNGSEQTRLTNNAAVDYDPAWSLDSKHISFVSFRDEPNPTTCKNCNSEIYVINTDGSEQTRLTKIMVAEFDAMWQPADQ